jgi:serine phosphatase RsbU (regulator of sigma subunit)
MNARVRVEPPASQAFSRDLLKNEVILGRLDTAGIVIPDQSVSRHHARLFTRDGRWWVEDLGARNGTLLNDEPVVKPMPLGAGDRLKIGETIVRFLPAEPVTQATAQIEDPLLDRQAARLKTLNEIHRALATPISLTDLLDLILERCFDVLKPEEGVIVLRQRDGSFRTAASRRKAGEAGDVLVSRSIVDEVVERGRPALVIDAAIDDRFSGSESIISSGVRSVVAAPLADAEGAIGMIALLSRVKVRKFSPQDLDMLSSLASAAALRVRNIALAEEAAARRVLERELALAHDMQMAMLPRRVPDRREIDLSASVTPARSVGGDLYDFLLIDDALWFIVADVSGKGVPAALYTAVAKTLFRATVRGAATVAEAVARMNEELARDNEQLIFTTAVVGRLTIPTGEVALGDAGHNPALLLRRDGLVVSPALPKCMALGVIADTPYAAGKVTLQPGDTLVLYTDGVIDARNPGGDLFGIERLEQVVADARGRAAEGIAAAILSANDRFTAGAAAEDDLTLLVLRYRGL